MNLLSLILLTKWRVIPLTDDRFILLVLINSHVLTAVPSGFAAWP